MFTWLPPMVWSDLTHGRLTGYLFFGTILYITYCIVCAVGSACSYIWRRRRPRATEEPSLEGEILPPEFPRRGC